MEEKVYKYELHCHENVVSACASWSPEELVAFYANLGYQGIVVTDHFFNGGTKIKEQIPWAEKVARFCEGYERAKKAGDECGLDVFFGFEYTANTFYGEDLSALPQATVDRVWRKNTMAGCDFLIYGLDKEWLLAQSEQTISLPVNEFFQKVRADGGVVVQAHPFRFLDMYMDHIALFPKFTQGIEVYNGNPNTIGRGNRLAKRYAEEYGFFQTAGSDSHFPCKYLAVTELKKRAESVQELFVEIQNGRANLRIEERNDEN